MASVNYAERMRDFITVYNRCFRNGATSMRDVAEQLGWPVTRVYKTVYVIRQWEKDHHTVLEGKLTKKNQLERELDNYGN